MGVAVEVIEKGFSKRGLTECELSILIGMDSFSYMVKDEEERVQALKEFQLDVAEDGETWSGILENEGLAGQAFRQVTLGIALAPFTFIPENLFDPKKARHYLQHLTELSRGDSVEALLLPELRAYNLFVIPSWLKKRIADLPEAEKQSHLSASLLRKAKVMSEASDQPFLWAHINPGRLWLGALENGELKYANSFAYETDNDALYYLLMLFEHTSLAPDRTTIHLSGKLSTDMNLFKNLIRFVAQPEFMNVDEKLIFGPQLQQYPSHWFFDILSLDH